VNTNSKPSSPGVVVGVDTTEQSENAAGWAAREAADRGTTLTVVHALDLPQDANRQFGSPGLLERRREEGAALLGRAVEHLARRHPDLQINTVLSDRSPAHALTELSLDAELVVTGTRGRSGLVVQLFGSVSGEVAARTFCPVVTVWGTQPATTKPELVLGLEPDEDLAPIDFAFRTAARLGLDLRAVRAFEPATAYEGCYVDDVEISREDAMIGLGSLLHQIRKQYPQVPITFEAKYGDPATVLHTAARDARLLVVGSHRRRDGLTPRLGSTVRELLAHPGTPVAVVPIQ
jgi:nucleotide-binding universal stress UspA family protein